MEKLKVTKKQMECYERIRVGGLTNMWVVSTVSMLSDGVLNGDDCVYIISNYDHLMKHYHIERGKVV